MQVSRGVGSDKIKMNFIWPHFFKTEKDSILLDMNYPLSINVPFQMKSKEDYENTFIGAKQIQTFTLWGIAGGFLLIMTSSVNGQMIFYLLESYQVIALISKLTTLPMPSKFKIKLSFLDYVMNFEITQIEQINKLLPSIMNENQQEVFEDFGEIVTTAIMVSIIVIVFLMIENIQKKLAPILNNHR